MPNIKRKMPGASTGRQFFHERHAGRADQRAQRSAGDGEYDALCQHMPKDLRAAGADG